VQYNSLYHCLDVPAGFLTNSFFPGGKRCDGEIGEGKRHETGLIAGTERREREVWLAFGLVKSGNAQVQESSSHPKESGVAAIH
jgi:hypothetical protein